MNWGQNVLHAQKQKSMHVFTIKCMQLINSLSDIYKSIYIFKAEIVRKANLQLAGQYTGCRKSYTGCNNKILFVKVCNLSALSFLTLYINCNKTPLDVLGTL